METTTTPTPAAEAPLTMDAFEELCAIEGAARELGGTVRGLLANRVTAARLADMFWHGEAAPTPAVSLDTLALEAETRTNPDMRFSFTAVSAVLMTMLDN